MKQCPLCHRVVWTFVHECPDCRYEWPSEKVVVTDDMVKLLSDDQLRQVEEGTMIEFFKAQRQKVFQTQLVPGWSRKVFFQKFGRWPEESWYYGAIFGPDPTMADKETYRDYLQAIAQQHQRSLKWVLNEFEKEFGSTAWKSIF